AVVWIIGVAVYIWLDTNGHRVFAVNVGNSPFLPLWLFALAGAIVGTILRVAPALSGRGMRRAYGVLVTAVGAIAGLLAIWLIARYGVDALFTRPLGRSDAGRLTPAPIYGGAALQVGYYNLRP